MQPDTTKQSQQEIQPVMREINTRANERGKRKRKVAQVYALPERIERFCKLLAEINREDVNVCR